MADSSRLPVVLLWHMHQPQYKDALTGSYVLPWTYLHAIKDYTDMAAHLEANPGARAVVNFTPVLLEQLDELAQAVTAHLADGAALPDPVLATLGPAPLPQEPGERAALMQACLRAQRRNLIERHAPYLELAKLAETLATPQGAGYASDAFIHDLALWYHLAWLGETVRRSDPRVAALEAQGRDFTPAQRRELLTLIGELLRGVIPRFRALADCGRCELSVTPYGHPIVPLLYDFHSARESVPESPLPRHPGYAGGPERAAWHVEEGLAVFERHFGRRPQGCWPAEGAVSADTLRLLDSRGFLWAASGGEVLRAALSAAGSSAGEAAAEGSGDAAAYNRPYRVPGQALQCFFRDDGLSDLIGFTYSTWRGDDAAANFVNAVAELARGAAAAPGHVLLVALDGENAWEYYPFNGYYFLTALYQGLAAHAGIELTTLSECVARGLTPVPLQRLVAGSWVHGTLATWMGDAAKNAGWDLLCEAKLVYDRVLAADTLPAEARSAAARQLALCESSDWFWWFGDYNPREAVSQFDELFRRQLTVLYRLLGRPVPDVLSQPICAGGGTMDNGGVMRRGAAT